MLDFVGVLLLEPEVRQQIANGTKNSEKMVAVLQLSELGKRVCKKKLKLRYRERLLFVSFAGCPLYGPRQRAFHEAARESWSKLLANGLEHGRSNKARCEEYSEEESAWMNREPEKAIGDSAVTESVVNTRKSK